MCASKGVDAVAALEGDILWHRVVAQLPQLVRSHKPVDLLIIDLDDVVKGGAAESVPPLARRGVEIRAAVGHQVHAVEPDFETGDVAVSMTAAPVHAHFTTVDEDMRALHCGNGPMPTAGCVLVRSGRRIGSSAPDDTASAR